MPSPVLPLGGLQISAPMLNPYTVVKPLTKSDTTTYSAMRGLYVGGAGDVAVADQDGNTATFSAVPVGTILPVCATQLLSTGTTATLVLGLW